MTFKLNFQIVFNVNIVAGYKTIYTKKVSEAARLTSLHVCFLF